MKRLKPSTVATWRLSRPIVPIRHSILLRLPFTRLYSSSPSTSTTESPSADPPSTTIETPPYQNDPATITTTARASKATNETLHHKIAKDLRFYDTSPLSPGAPLFRPAGAHIFNKLISFLRAQYALHGFQEVVTPTMFKNKLWKESGHFDHFESDMFQVRSPKKKVYENVQDGQDADTASWDNGYRLKPMNCPGHCLIYKMKKIGWSKLPVRYAEFGTLHRNEISSALTGLTRVIRFHQDDAHIFCRQDQIAQEIASTLSMIDSVYSVFSLQNYRFLLSTRPKDKFSGTIEEWDRAEAALKASLEASGKKWSINEGDGAFYGPKIDVILTDSAGKEHQTATVQLDFQLPKNFDLSYDTQAKRPKQQTKRAELQAIIKGNKEVTAVDVEDAEVKETEANEADVNEAEVEPIEIKKARTEEVIVEESESEEGSKNEAVTTQEQSQSETPNDSGVPVMIHRAVFGSLERFMALLIEKYDHHWPFWINPRQVIILPVNGKPEVEEFGKKVKSILSGVDPESKRQEIGKRTFNVEFDGYGRHFNNSVKEARTMGYSVIIFIGSREVESQSVAPEIWKDGQYVKMEKLEVDKWYQKFVEMEREYQ
ncbi:hypothetical protein ABW20_dc0107996 [Dactylellina cionopaga]|nr:hypothetical protein ABW20_dc0107996 [Dactylellina cionopaga]